MLRPVFRWGHGFARHEICKGNGTRSAHRPDVGTCSRHQPGESGTGRQPAVERNERELAVERLVAGILAGASDVFDVTVTPLAMHHRITTSPAPCGATNARLAPSGVIRYVFV